MRCFKVSMILLLILCWFLPGYAENDGDCLYTLIGTDGEVLTQRAGRMYEGDEYIASDNRCYRVVSINDATQTATAEYVGTEPNDEAAFSILSAASAESKRAGNSDRKLICMYSTHSDESYIPGDGTESKWNGAGIYDVGEHLKNALGKLGIDAVYSKETFLPHDADAYTRSRRTAEELMKQGPDALIDVHRDAVPAEQYETEVNGDDISKVRLFVGRTNSNAAANRAFAKQLKAAADEAYPGLVKDIFIGRGNYNQDLYANSILLEFGTHEIEKEKAEASTEYMAKVLNTVLYKNGAGSSGGAATRPAAKGIGWTVLLLVGAAIGYALLATGSGKEALHKLGRNASELTGGLFGGKKPRD